MGICYSLYNFTKREMVSLAHMPGATAREIAGDPATAAVVAWYMLRNRGDSISMIGDIEIDPEDRRWPYPVPVEELVSFPDRTDAMIDELIHHQILADHGYLYRAEEEPERWYIRDLRNVWKDGPAGETRPLPPLDL